MFAPDGRRQWEVEGREATRNSLDRVEIRDMRMRLFPSGNAVEAWQVESPSAYLFVRSAVVEGRGPLLVRGHGFCASGRDWQWFGKERQLRVHRQVEVRFGDPAAFPEAMAP